MFAIFNQEMIISLVTALFSVLVGVIVTLAGIIYHRLRERVRELESLVHRLEEVILKNKKGVETSHDFMFGHEEDETNIGISKKILKIRKRLEKLIDALHDEESLEFDREDIK